MSMKRYAVPSSFRDDDSFVFKKNGVIFRCINNSYKEHYDHFIHSGLYDRLVLRKLIIPHQEVANFPISGSQYKILKPECVPFISYPYEWCFSQLKDAALLTLQLQEVALCYGMVLKDASAFNVQFYNGRPLLIDTSSFMKHEQGKPWVAYKQFCEFFIAPLILMSRIDAYFGKLLQIFIEGIPINLVSKVLPWRSRLNIFYFFHIYLHAHMLGRTKNGNLGYFFREHYLQYLTRHLYSFVHAIKSPARYSSWPAYYKDCNENKKEYLRDKERIVMDWLKRVGAQNIWDIGSNTGHFSRLAAALGMRVVALDCDHDAIDTLYTTLKKEENTRITPLWFDISQPSPAIGFANQERDTIWGRGSADVALCLSLTHHLYFKNLIPFDKMGELLNHIGAFAIVEFVPCDDQLLKEMIVIATPQRKLGYNQSNFEKSFSIFFHIQDRKIIGDSGRVLYLMKSKNHVP